MGRRVFTAILPGVSLPPYLSTSWIILTNFLWVYMYFVEPVVSFL